MNPRSGAGRYWISLLVALCALIIANVIDYHQYQCVDCFVQYGVPFMYMQDGGWVPRAILWGGLAADLAVAAVFAGLIAWVWGRFAKSNLTK